MGLLFILSLLSLLMLSIGTLIGIAIEEKINKSYFLKMIDIVENSLEKHNEIYKEYYKDNNENYDTYINKVLDAIIDSQKFLAGAMDEINKNCYVPIWKDVDKELPECEGIYYGKKDDTNSMWKVIFRNNEWYLSGYPEHKIDIIKWTELY